MATVPLAAPAVVGANVTVIVQVVPAASVPPLVVQVPPDMANCGPPVGTVKVPPARAMFPVFDTINVFAGLVVPVNWLPNASEVADTVNVRTGATPVPVRPTGDPEIVTLPVMDAVPVDAPRAVGEYVTRIVQVEVAARVPPHVPPALANGAVTVTVIPVKLAPPVLFRVR